MEVVKRKESADADTKRAGPAKIKKQSLLKKIDQESAKLLSSLKDRANKKSFGRKVKDSEIIAVGLTLVSVEHLEQLQEKTYSERDRLDQLFQGHQKAYGKLTMDQFLGKLMRGEVKAPEVKALEVRT